MKPRTRQIIISGFAVPAFAFIALNRWATNQHLWASIWAFLSLGHLWMLIDAIRSKNQGGSNV